MRMTDHILDKIEQQKDVVILRSDIASCGSPSQVSVVLKTLQEQGVLLRISTGVYAKAMVHPRTGEVTPICNAITVAIEAYRRLGVEITVNESSGKSRVSQTQPCPRKELHIRTIGKKVNRHLAVGDYFVVYDKEHKTMEQPNKHHLVRSRQTHELKIPSAGLKKFILDLAKVHHVKFVRTFRDHWAESVTRLAGDEITQDPVKDALVALKRADKLTSTEMTRLLVNYLREQKRVRSV